MEERQTAVPGGQDGPDLARVVERAKHELEQMIDLAPQIIMLVDRSGRIARVNRSLLNFLGAASFHDVLGKALEELFPSDKPEMLACFRPGPESDQAQEMDVRMPDGSLRPLQFVALGSARGAEVRVVVVRDIKADKEQAALDERRHKMQAVRALVLTLMDSINQHLTVITCKTYAMSVELKKHEGCEHALRGLEEIRQHAIKVADILKRMNETREVVIESFMPGIELIASRGGDEGRS